MTWTKLDDGFWSHPKIDSVGNEAVGAYTRMLSYCGQQLTDGKVPASVARYITRRPILNRLADAGLVTENGSGWLIPDYLDFNPSADQVKLDRKRARERMRKVRGKAA